MKKYLITSAAALALCGLITSCTHDLSTSDAVQSTVIDTYEKAFITAFGQPSPNQEWGFGTTTVAGVRGKTRAVPTFPNDFRDKTNVSKPGTIQKPTITKTDNAIVISGEQTLNSVNDYSVVYLESDAVLTLPDWFSLQNVKFYMSSGSRLNAQNLSLKGTTEFVNDGGTIQVGTNNIVLENSSGTFWNNGTINVKEFTTGNSDGGKIYLGSGSNLNATKIFLFKNFSFWNEGNITLTSEFNADQYGHKIYNSGTITTPKIILQKNTDLWNEGTITAANNKEVTASIYNDNVNIYNGINSTLKLDVMSLSNNGQLVVNDGILNVKGKITVPNNSEIVNYNKLTGGEFEMKSGSKFYNVSGGEVTISGLSKITNNSSGNNKDNVWLNSGKYTTGSFEATGGCQNPNVYNNCHLYVTGKFLMNEANFVLDGGAAVECGSFEWNSNNYFHMGGKALLKVTGQLLSKNQNSSPKYGFWGDDTDYAVIQAGSIEKESEGQYRAAYYGNLFIDTNNHFAQGGTDAQPWYYFDTSVKFSFDDNSTSTVKKATKATNFSITIPKDNDKGCTPGYKYGDDPEPSGDIVRVICEDLTVTQNSDFDFNDVVFDVQLDKTGTKAILTFLAAGGTLPLTVAGKEVHKLFAEANPGRGITRTSMINTRGTGDKYTHRNCSTAVITIDNVYGSTVVKDVAKAIPIQVQKLVNGKLTSIELKCDKGQATAKVAVDDTYNWCDERENINEKYKYKDIQGNEYGGFSLFVRDVFTADEWYRYKGPLDNDQAQEYLNH